MRKKSNRTLGENKPNQSQLPPGLVTAERAGAGQGWGLKVANDVNYPLRCLKKLPTNLTRTRRAQRTQN